MAQKNNNRTTQAVDLIPKLIEAALAGNRQRIELLSLSAARVLQADNPTTSKEITALLAQSGNISAPVRWLTPEPIPTDQDEGLSLLKADTGLGLPPILADEVNARVETFIQEREQADTLLSEGFSPPRTVLLKGPPGTGKTTLARNIASRLGLNLVVLDLATVISSFLGKTGLNLRRGLDYARANPCVLLLDELDSVAKRRDDSTDVGELNRIVNVLLKELEEWPISSVLIGATNHPELLDKAIHRRFDVVIEIPLPGPFERQAILRRSCGQFAEMVPENLFLALSHCFTGANASQLETMAQSAVRRYLVEKFPLSRSFCGELKQKLIEVKADGRSKKEINSLIENFQKDTGLTVREIGEIFDLSPSAVQYHLTKKEKDIKKGGADAQ